MNSETMTVLLENPDAKQALRHDWKETGWQGLTLHTPSAWNLVAFSGEQAKGSLRMDNGETSGTAAGVEIRWQHIKGRITDADIEKRLERYFAGIRRTVKRQRLVVDAKSKKVVDERHPERDLSRTFSWRSDRKAVGRIWHCTECGRLVIAQVVGAQGGLSPAAPDVLRSLQCHPADDNWQTWSLYDLLTQVPAEYALRGKPQLMNIYVQLMFGRGQSADTLSVEQWSVANVQLRGAYLDEWFRQKNAAQEPLLRYEGQEVTVQGHAALLLTGRRRGLTYWASQAGPHLAKLQMPATHFCACLWECPESNKIYLMQSYSRRPQIETLMQAAGRTPCH